jgi:hypothetical protein
MVYALSTQFKVAKLVRIQLDLMYKLKAWINKTIDYITFFHLVLPSLEKVIIII